MGCKRNYVFFDTIFAYGLWWTGKRWTETLIGKVIKLVQSHNFAEELLPVHSVYEKCVQKNVLSYTSLTDRIVVPYEDEIKNMRTE